MCIEVIRLAMFIWLGPVSCDWLLSEKGIQTNSYFKQRQAAK